MFCRYQYILYYCVKNRFFTCFPRESTGADPSSFDKRTFCLRFPACETCTSLNSDFLFCNTDPHGIHSHMLQLQAKCFKSKEIIQLLLLQLLLLLLHCQIKNTVCLLILCWHRQLTSHSGMLERGDLWAGKATGTRVPSQTHQASRYK